MMPIARSYRDGRILHDARNDRLEVWDIYTRPSSLYCGESFEMKVGQRFLPCRIEMDRERFIGSLNLATLSSICIPM